MKTQNKAVEAPKTTQNSVLSVVTAKSDISLATELHALVQRREEIEVREKEVRGQLLALLKAQGVKSVKLENGTQYLRVFKTTLQVKDEVEAEKWADEWNSWKIDTARAYKIIKLNQEDVPSCFVKKETEYLTVRTKDSKEDDE